MTVATASSCYFEVPVNVGEHYTEKDLHAERAIQVSGVWRPE